MTKSEWIRVWPLTLMVMAPLALAQAAKPTPAARLAQLLQRTRSLSAQFHETVEHSNGMAIKHSSGEVLIAKPGRFLWNYKRPYRQLIVADGKTLWIYDPSLQQVTEKPEPGTLSAGPAALLAGRANVSKHFQVSALPSHDGLDWLKLVPKNPNTDYRAIELGLAPGEQIREMKLVSHLGDTTRLVFSHVVRNRPIPLSRFKFTPPAGTSVVHEASPSKGRPPATG